MVEKLSWAGFNLKTTHVTFRAQKSVQKGMEIGWNLCDLFLVTLK